jgi:hypothetical protein
LLGNDQAGGLCEKLLKVVTLIWRLFIELDDRRFLRDGDLRVGHFPHDVLELGPGIIVRMRSGDRFPGNVDFLGGDGRLSVKRKWEGHSRSSQGKRDTPDSMETGHGGSGYKFVMFVAILLFDPPEKEGRAA